MQKLQHIIQNLNTIFAHDIELRLVENNNSPQLDLIVNQKPIRFSIEFKTTINRSLITILKHQKQQHQTPFLLITPYVNPVLAKELKQQEIQFMDTAGNAYINQTPLYIYIQGNKLPNLPNTTTRRLFKPAGLKVLFALLTVPELVNKPYREIAKTAQVSLGTLTWVMNDLVELGYLIDLGKKGKKLINMQRLVEKWCSEYNQTLKPRLIIDRFNGPENWWQQLNPVQHNAQWGGEVAAALLTQYLKPVNTLLYLNDMNYSKIIQQNHLYQDKNGNTLFIQYPINIQPVDKTVHPLLIYADLLDTTDPRSMETAKVIYDQYIVQLVGEN